MSFLDDLENTLKNLERGDERDRTEFQRRDAERAAARAAAPFAEALKTGPFANAFLGHAVRIAHGSRTKVNMAWLGPTLRVEARERRLEFRPTAEGVLAVFSRDGVETSSQIVDLASDPKALAEHWLAS